MEWDGALPILAVTVVLYHLSELLLVAVIEPEELSTASLLLSPPYLLAMALGLCEYALERRAQPAAKQLALQMLRLPAVALLCGGELLRKAAWLTARASFTHRIKTYQRPNHRLVTWGVYARCRHPGYLGWTLWAIGTQVLLANPVCTVLFAAVSWRFFSVRVRVEEFHLRNIFGQRYVEYRRRTPTYMPGIP